MKKEELNDIRSAICNACNNQFPEEPCAPGECGILHCMTPIIESKYIPVPKEMKKAVRQAIKHYQEAMNGDFFRDPVAWALYHAWKDVERSKL